MVLLIECPSLNGFLPYYYSVFSGKLQLLKLQKEITSQQAEAFAYINLFNNILTNISNIMKELDDIITWGNTRPNFIDEYKKNHNALPFGV